MLRKLLSYFLPMAYTGGPSFDRLFADLGVGNEVGFPLSCAAWIRKTGANWDLTSDDSVFQFNANTTGDDSSIEITNDNGVDKMAAASWSNSPDLQRDVLTKGATEYDDEWVLVVGTWADDTNRRIYLGTTQDGLGQSNEQLTSDFRYIAFGNNAHSAFAGWDGDIAEACIWTRELTPAEVATLQTGSEKGITPSSLHPNDVLGYWSLRVNQSSHTDEGPNSGPTLTVESGMAFQSDHPDIGLPITIQVPTGPQF
jgi:hypothetical protein